MKVLDNTFLVDYDNGVDATRAYFEAHADEEFVIPAPVYTEFLLGEVYSEEETDLETFAANVEWATISEVDADLARLAAAVADEIGPSGPQLTAVDAIVVATARRLGGTVVSRDGHHTHDETRTVVNVDTY